ncbi:MAG TPA: hypothetical protein VGM64_14645 [Lacunisphaera sp.]|jgi:hypothetical protein
MKIDLNGELIGLTGTKRGRPGTTFSQIGLLMFLIGLLAVQLRATTVIPPTFSELVNESDYIVRTRVKSVTSEWKDIANRRVIFTHVEMEVIEVIHGNPPQPLILEMLGGRVGGDEMVVQGMPKFLAGQEDILFVRGNGHQFYPLTAAMHGRYLIVHEQGGRTHVERANRKPLHNTREVSLPMDDPTLSGNSSLAGSESGSQAETPPLSAESFTAQIRAAFDARYVRTKK